MEKCNVQHYKSCISFSLIKSLSELPRFKSQTRKEVARTRHAPLLHAARIIAHDDTRSTTVYKPDRRTKRPWNAGGKEMIFALVVAWRKVAWGLPISIRIRTDCYFQHNVRDWQISSLLLVSVGGTATCSNVSRVTIKILWIKTLLRKL